MLRPARVLLGVALAAHPTLTAAKGVAEADPDAVDPDPALRAVTLGLDGAELTAVLTFEVRTSGPALIDLDLGLGLPLPTSATVTAVRLADGTVRRDGVRTTAEAAQAGADAIDEAAPAARRRGYALVRADEAGQVSVRLGLPDAGRRALTLQVRAPTCVLDDHRWAAVPPEWTPRLHGAARVRRASAVEEARLRVACLTPASWIDPGDGGDPSQRAWIGLPDPALRRLRADPARAQVTIEQFAYAPRRLGRVELALGRSLTAMPVAPHVVVLLDGSRSLDEADWDAQRALVDAYLARAPRGTRVALLAYARTPRRLLPGWVEAEAARRRARPALATLVRGNGSEVSAALAEAARLLTGVPGERRVLLVSDELLRRREQVRAAELHQLLPAGVRLITVDVSGGARLTRHDGSRFASSAAASGGIAMTSEDGAAWDDPTPLDATALWRPTSLDQISVDATGWSELTAPPGLAPCAGLRRRADGPFDLAEGSGCTWWATSGGHAVPPVRLRGLLWNQPWTGTAGAVTSTALTRQLGPTPPRPELAPLWRQAAAAGGHVDPAWSLLVTWGSGGGYGDQATIMGGLTCDCDGPGEVGFGLGQARPPRPLEPLVRATVAPCLVPGVALTITLETTRSEIVAVDVDARGVDPSSHLAGADVATCAEAALWATPLDFDGDDHASPTITIPATR